MAAKKPTLFWQGHPVRDEAHQRELDLKAAIFQFHHGLDRAAAEQRVKHEDRVERHQKAAAHHLDGMRAANAVGNHEDAQQHHGLYTLHVKALGHDPATAVHPDVSKWQGKNAEKHAYTFKGHGDDQFLVQSVQAPGGLAKSESDLKAKCRHCGLPGTDKKHNFFQPETFDHLHETDQDVENRKAAIAATYQKSEQPSDPEHYQHVMGPVEQDLVEKTKGADTRCPTCGRQQHPVEKLNDYCSGCAKDLKEAVAARAETPFPASDEEHEANMHRLLSALQSAGSPAAIGGAKDKLLGYLRKLGIEGASVDEYAGVAGQDTAPSKPPLRVFEGGAKGSAPKYGHLRVVKMERWPHILASWTSLAKADPDDPSRVKQFDVRKTWLRHRHLPEDKAFDYSGWLTPEQRQNGYKMFVLSHGKGNPVRVHVTHSQQKAGSASGNVDQGDLEVEKFNLAGGAHHNRGLEESMLNAMMGHAKHFMDADYLSHGPFTPEASGLIEAMAKPHGFQLGEAEDIDDGETPADQKPAQLVTGGIKVRSKDPKRTPRSFSPRVPQWWRTDAEESD